MKDPRTLLNKQTTQNTQINTIKSTGMKDPRTLVNVQTPKTPAPTPTQNAFNILNKANKVQNYNNVGTPEAILNKGIAQPNRQTYNNANANLLKNEIEKAVNNAQKSKREEELKKMNPIARMNEEIMATIEGEDYYTEEKKERPTLLREHIAGTASLGLTDVYQEQSKKDKSVTAKVYDEYLEKLRNNEKEYVDKLGQENYSKLFEEIYNNSNQKPIDRDFFTQLRLNLGGGNVQGVTNIVNAGAMLVNDEFGKNVSEATRWSRDLNKQIMQGNQGKGFGTQVLNASNTIGNMIPTIAGTTVNPILGKVALFGNAAGGAYNEALDNGASSGQAKANAILSGGAELAIESLSGGISNKLLGSKALFNPSNLTKNISNKFIKGGIDFVLEVLGEGIEEVATTALQPVIDRITYNPNATTSGEELWASFRDSILPTLLLQGFGTATSGINNYSENQIKQIQNSNLTQEQKTDLINKTIKQRDKLLNEVQNTEQPAQNVAPQSPNTQIQQQTNEVIPQQIETQQNANLVQNNTQIAQNTPNNEQISQNNVQNVNNSKNIVNENNEETKNIKQESITISQRPTYDIEYKGKKLKAEVRSYSPQNNRYFVKYTMGNGSSNFIELPADVFSNEAKNELSHYIGNINKKEQGLEKTGENFVYHGTLANVKGEDLKASDMGDLGEGLYFAREKEIAEKFSDIGFRNNNLERMRDGRYIDINTGKIFEAGTPHLIEASIDNLNIKQMEPTEWYNAIESLRDKKTNRLPINYETVAQKQFKEQGYDGIELINAGNNNQVVIFPDSIKKIQYNLSNIKDSQQNNSVDEALNRATTNKFSKGKTILGKINDFAKNKIQQLLGIDVSNRQHTLADNDIRHMLNEHGNAEIEAKRGQIPITEADVKRIPSIIDSPDDIVLGSRHQDGQTVRYVKKFEDGINFVVEVVPEKSGALKIKTMWKKPIAVVNSINTPNLTSKTEGNMINSTSSNNIIQSNENYVNNQNIMPSVEQLQARELKQGEEISNTLNMRKTESDENANQEKVAEILNDSEKSKTSLKELAKETVNDFKRAFVDAGTDIAEIGKITNDKTLYHLFNSAKQSGQSANYMISEAQTNLQGDTVGKSLIDIFEPIRQNGQDYYKEFEYYMYHLHNIDRMKQGKPVFGKNVTADDSKNIVKEFETKYPEFPEYAEDIRKWNANLQQFRIDTGLISQEQADIMNEMYPNYVPTYRDTNGISGATKSGSVVKIVDTIKKATGSNKDILPLHEQMARQVMQTVQAGRRNVLGMQLYYDAIKNADKLGEYVQQIKTTKEDVEKDADFEFEQQDLEGKFVVFDNGKRVEMQVSKGVLEGLKSLSSAKWESNLLSKGMKKANSTFKKLVTEWNLGFLVKNAVRDIQDAGLYSENVKEFYKNYPQAWKEITSNGELWQKYLAMGGSDASLFDFEQGYIVPKEGIPNKIIEKISKANFLVEQAPRFAEFLRIYNKSDKSYNALMEAMYGAADITVNFGRSGTWGKFINNNLVPFFNPAIQGTSKTLRTITGDGNVQGKKNFAKHMANIVGKGVLLGVAPTMINHILLEAFGGDDYDDLNERDKDMYFLIPTGDGKYFKLPKGRVLSVIGGFVRRGFDYATGNKDSYKGFGEFALGQTAPTNPFENSLYAPIQAVKNNTTWYGTPIENQTLQNYRPAQRYDEGTTEFSKWLGKTINYSPKKIDYLLDAYGGAVADVLMPLNTKKAESSGLGKSFTLDSATSNRLSTDFYDTIEELTYDKNDDDQVAKMQLKYMNDVKAKAQDINKQIKDLQAGNTKDKEKLEKVRELKKEINTLHRDALNTYEKYGQTANSYLENDAFIEFVLRGTKEETTEASKLDKIEKTVKAYTDRDLFGAEYALAEYNKNVYENQQEAEQYGIDSELFFKAYFAQKDVEGEKNQFTGKTKTGTKKQARIKAIDEAVGDNLNTWQINKLYEILN